MVTKDWLANLLGLILRLDETGRRVVSGNTRLPKCHPVTQETGRVFVFLYKLSFHNLLFNSYGVQNMVLT